MITEPPDPTMRSLLAVHRAEVNDLEDRLKLANQNLDNSRYVNDGYTADIRRLKDDVKRLESTLRRVQEKADGLQGERDGLSAKFEKRGEVIASLKLELEAERKAHSTLRDEGVRQEEG